MKLLLPTLSAIITLLVAKPIHGSAQSAPGVSSAAAISVPATPRRADGHPDLNGVWTQRNDGGPVSAGKVQEKDISADGRVITSTCCGRSRLGGLYSGEQDGKVIAKGNRNKPMYKPEYWAKVQDMERHSQQRDPEFHCAPWGVPRMGEPQQIVQQDNQIIFLYTSVSFGNPYRVIPMDRPHDPDRVVQETFRGDSVGHWEGDTLVVDTIGFNDESWLSSRLGYIHSTSLHVVERLTRQADKIKYQVTVEDPEMLLMPWEWDARTMTLNPNPTAMLPEDFPCSERDQTYTPVR